MSDYIDRDLNSHQPSIATRLRPAIRSIRSSRLGYAIRSARIGSCYSLGSGHIDRSTRLGLFARLYSTRLDLALYQSSLSLVYHYNKVKGALTCPGTRLPSNNCGDITFGTYVLKLNACLESLAPLVLLQRCACSIA
jgi:hypothetical protein